MNARQRGVTLVELITVMVVLAILSTIAVASYRSYLLRANRIDATGALLRVQVAQEKFFLQNNRYAINAEVQAAPPAGLGIVLAAGDITINGYYRISVANGAGNLSYTATADAVAGQLEDAAACQQYTVDSTGTRGTAAAVAGGCWR